MADFLISALTAELGSGLRCILGVLARLALMLKTKFRIAFYEQVPWTWENI